MVEDGKTTDLVGVKDYFLREILQISLNKLTVYLEHVLDNAMCCQLSVFL